MLQLVLNKFIYFAENTESEADEEDTHIANESDNEVNKDNERIDGDTMCDEQASPDQPNNEISISLLRAKNLSLLQSQ